MQLVWVVVAGAVLAWLYLAAFHALLCGRRAPRMSLLLAIAGFTEMTVVVLVFVWVLSEGRFERLTAALAGFVVARALLQERMFAEWDERGAEEPDAAVGRRKRREALGQQPLDRLA